MIGLILLAVEVWEGFSEVEFGFGGMLFERFCLYLLVEVLEFCEIVLFCVWWSFES